MKKFTIKNRIQEERLFRRRCYVAGILILICSGLLLGSWLKLQVFQYRYYSTLSLKNAIELRPIVPLRGLIYDRNGLLLADNIPVFNLVVLSNNKKNIESTLSKLQSSPWVSISETEMDQCKDQLRKHRRFDEIPLKVKLTEAEVARFAEQQYRYPGIAIKADLIRYYPFRDLFSPALGYVGRINNTDITELVDSSNYAGTSFIGKIGVEKYYETELHGTVGYERAEVDANGQIIHILQQIPSVKGNDLYLSIDTTLQKAAADALSQKRGAVVAINPTTGEILAFVSSPSYDPNLFVQGIDNPTFQSLTEDIDRPLYNRALRGLYAPGSTIKPFIAIEGLESGVINQDFKLFDPGWYKLPNTTHIFYDWKEKGHGWVNIETAIIQSCDTFFYELARRLGIQRIDNILTAFGFGKLTGIDMGEELSGNVPTPEWKKRVKKMPWFGGDTVISGIGQGSLLVTPLQLASAVSTIANQGRHYRPHLVHAIKLSDGTIIENHPIEEESIALTSSINYWDIITEAMEGVIQKGTGTQFGKAPYTVAGKTGTAQIYHIERDLQGKKKKVARALRLQDNALFIAFAPIPNPTIALAVVVENEHSALIVARKVMDAYFTMETKTDGH